MPTESLHAGPRVEQDKRSAESLEAASAKKKSGLASLTAGNSNQALVDLQAALTIEVQELGEKHTIPASTKLHIGGILYSNGKNEEALNTFNEALPILNNEMLSTNKALAASSLSQAACHFNLGDYAKSIVCYQTALAYQKTVLGDKHIEVPPR